jgi:hypothetical protein
MYRKIGQLVQKLKERIHTGNSMADLCSRFVH